MNVTIRKAQDYVDTRKRMFGPRLLQVVDIIRRLPVGKEAVFDEGPWAHFDKKRKYGASTRFGSDCHRAGRIVDPDRVYRCRHDRENGLLICTRTV